MGGNCSEHEMRGMGWTRVAKHSHQEAGKQCPNGLRYGPEHGNQKQYISIEISISLDMNIEVSEPRHVLSVSDGLNCYCMVKAMVESYNLISGIYVN